MHYLVLRTHGGLGNQIFQVFYGRLFAEQAGLSLREVHDSRYRHAFMRTEALAMAPEPGRWQLLVSFMRLPKIFQRVTGSLSGEVRIGETIYLDAYFQSTQVFEDFPPSMLARHLARLANELRIVSADLDSNLVHLRLGDFFTNRTQACQHLIDRLARVNEGSAVITNDESLLQEPDVVALMKSRALKLISTKDMSAEDVLRIMSRYKVIDANDSTLTFWASVLGGCDVSLKNSALSECCNFLKKYR